MIFVSALFCGAVGQHVFERCAARLRKRYGKDGLVTELFEKHASYIAIRCKNALRSNRGVFTEGSETVLWPYGLYKSGLWSGAADWLPPFVEIRVDARSGRMTIENDYIGLARVYVYNDPEIYLVTNMPFIVAQVIGPQIDLEALATAAHASWPFGTGTFHRRIKHLPPHSQLAAKVEGEQIAVSAEKGRFRDLLDLAAEANAAEVLTAVARSIANAAKGSISLSLSGGRDSRLMASLFLSTGAQPTFSTIDRFNDETATVRALLRAAHIPDERLAVHKPGGGQALPKDPYKQAFDTVEAHAGFCDPLYIAYGSARRGLLNLRDENLIVSGAAGEIGHGHYYPRPIGTRLDESIDFYADSLARRFQYATIASPAVQAVIRATILADLSRFSEDVGGAAIRSLDLWYLFERFRRWSGISANHNSLAPLGHLGFVAACLAAPVSEIIASSILYRLTKAWMPVWADIPYFTGAASQPSNIEEVPVALARDIYERAKGRRDLADIVDWPFVESIISAWDATPRPRREAITRRLLWLATICEQSANQG